MAGTTNTEYLYPDTWTNLTDTASNYAAGIPDYLNNVTENWYSDPLTTGVTTDQQAAYDALGSSDFAGGAADYLSQATDLYAAGSEYDSAELQKYLNPYLNDANQATVDLSNQNLFESILPKVNSTFTGSGQFGSSRNADFENRAIRDQQKTLSDTLAASNLEAYKAANADYLNWAQQGSSAASGLASLASQEAALGQQDLTNQMTAADAAQKLEQSTLDKSYEDWLNKQQFSISGLSSLATAIGNMAKGVEPNSSTPVAEADDVSKVLAAIQAATSGLNDSSIQSVLDYLFPDSEFTFSSE